MINIILFIWLSFILLFSLSGCSSPQLRSIGNGILFEMAFELGGSDRGAPIIKGYKLPEEYEVRAILHERKGYE